MSDALRQARRSLGRGRADEALVVLWNEVEAARVRGDGGALREIEAFAQHIARHDEDNRREAERLLETLHGAAAAGPGDEPVRPATAQLEADVQVGGEHVDPTAGAELPAGAEPEAGQRPGGMRIGPLIWLLIFVAVLLFNLFGEGRG